MERRQYEGEGGKKRVGKEGSMKRVGKEGEEMEIRE